MKYPFKRDPEGGVIFVNIQLDNIHAFKMVLDTAASRTTLDTAALYIADYKIDKVLGKNLVETANGIVEADVLEVNTLTALGHTKYDFLAHGILSDYDGLLGLDFFENKLVCIDFKTNTIQVE